MTEQPVVIRKPVAPPSDVVYAHKLGRGMLLPEQIMELVKAINPAYVASKQSNSYLAHHQARAEMNRIFGYGSWSTEVDEITLIWEKEIWPKVNDPDYPKDAQGKERGTKVYYRACYRGRVTVEVRDLWGMPVTSYQGVHVEANSNLPDRGEAHAMAVTSLESYALRRALLNMGDRFGLGLYNKGSMAAHGQYTIQLQPGILSTWEQGAPVLPTHETILAEQAVDVTYVSERAEEQAPVAPGPNDGILPDVVEQLESTPALQPDGRERRTTRKQDVANMQGVQQNLQAQREQAKQGAYPAPQGNMTERLQAGLKRDEQPNGR